MKGAFDMHYSSVAIIVVTYNRKDLLTECITAILNSDYQYYELFVIDNASTDGTKKELSYYWMHEKVHYINTGENLGGAGGFNYGLKNTGIEKYQYAWIMDDDTIVNSDTLTNFVSYCDEHENVGFVTGKVLWKDASFCTMNVPKINKWKRVSKFDEKQRVQYASFVSLFVCVDVIKELGLPYKEFFIWGDDWEYTRRISKRYDCVYLPNCIVTHKCVSNAGADIVNCAKDRVDRFKYMYRNDVVLYRQDGFEGYWYLFIRTILHTIRILFKTKENKSNKLKIMYQSLVRGFSFKPDVEYVGKEN
ncbi:glycosyltransferase [Lacrimispora sp.]|uniref:glycosyltransferase n=1 Tax=Lacrimispora sp. TaxID=2719234 RepID=UPI0028AE87EE|nr:glycosyltransferase [Lacrimispora sp.]